jgi:hypothetical protein
MVFGCTGSLSVLCALCLLVVLVEGGVYKATSIP